MCCFLINTYRHRNIYNTIPTKQAPPPDMPLSNIQHNESHIQREDLIEQKRPNKNKA